MIVTQSCKTLTIERQRGEPRDVLGRLTRELKEYFSSTTIRVDEQGRFKLTWREYVKLRFPDEASAMAAEAWTKTFFKTNQPSA